MPGSTVTVTGAGQFEMRLNAAVGGGIDQFFDLAEDPSRSWDLAGGTGAQVLLFEDEVVTTPTYSYPEDPRGQVHLLESTATRAKVRQESSYVNSPGTTRLAGVRGIGDYAIYPSGRMATAWTRKTTAARAYSALQLNFTVRYESTAPYSAWAAYAESGYMGPSQPGDDDFVLLQSDVANARTDFLSIMNADWTGAHGAQEIFSNYDSTLNHLSEATWQRYSGGTLPAGSGALQPAAGRGLELPDLFQAHGLRGQRGPGRHVETQRLPHARHPGNQRREGKPVAGRRRAHLCPRRLLQRVRGGLCLRPEPRHGPRLQPRREHDHPLLALLQDPPVALPQRPQAITVGGVTKSRDLHYKADVKPVTFAAFADSITWHSTLQDAAALTGTPDIGDPGTVGIGITYPAARYGAGAWVPADTAFITFPISGFDKAVGAVDFWFQPTWASGDGFRHDIAGFYVNATNQLLLQKLADNSLHFTIVTSAGTSDLVVAPAAYGWEVADWVHVILQWNDTFSLANQQVLYVNGSRPAHTDPVVDYNSALLTPGTAFYFGNINNGDLSFAQGIYDEVSAYSHTALDLSQGALAHGGLLANPLEFLASPSDNADLSLGVVNGTRQGEYLYFGSDSRFRGLNVVLARAGAGTADLQWQFWDGTSWANLEAVAGFTDGTNSLKANGTLSWTADPTGWNPYAIGGGTDLYYVRAYLASGSYSPSPIESRITTDILLVQYCADVASNTSFVFAVPATTAVRLMAFDALGSDAAVDLSWQTGLGGGQPGLPRLPVAGGGQPVDKAHPDPDPGPGLLGDGRRLRLA